MNLRSLLFVVFSASVTIAACGDHVTVPNDKTGKCVAGLLTKCGETCVDTKVDGANCGACGTVCGGAKVCADSKCVDACPPGSTKCGDSCSNTDVDRANCGMCGKPCAGTDVCAKGKCVATCEAVGYMTCTGMTGPVDAGAAMNCVDGERDPNNCGACGNKCMASDTCTHGVCCGAFQIGCNGTCVDFRSDEANCGGCGNVCGVAAPHCVFGACSKCNNEVLILADNGTAANADMKKAFQAAGFATTLIDSGSASYTGTPAATDFGTIVVFRVGFLGNMMDLPMSGQQAIVAAQQAGTGIVLDAYDMYDAYQYGHLSLIKPFMLYNYTSGIASFGPVSQFGSQPTFFAGTQTNFNTNVQNAWFFGSVTNNGVQFANVLVSNMTVPSGYYRASPNGRIVHYGFGINWSGGAQQMWTQDPQQTTWFLNGVRWTAGCSN